MPCTLIPHRMLPQSPFPHHTFKTLLRTLMLPPTPQLLHPDLLPLHHKRHLHRLLENLPPRHLPPLALSHHLPRHRDHNAALPIRDPQHARPPTLEELLHTPRRLGSVRAPDVHPCEWCAVLFHAAREEEFVVGEEAGAGGDVGAQAGGGEGGGGGVVAVEGDDAAAGGAAGGGEDGGGGGEVDVCVGEGGGVGRGRGGWGDGGEAGGGEVEAGEEGGAEGA